VGSGFNYYFRTFPKNILIIAGIGHMGVFLHHNNILMGLRHDPGSLRIVPLAGSFQGLRQRECNGSATAKYEGSCRSTGAGRLCCGYEKSPCAFAPVCHFFVLPFPAFLRIISLDRLHSRPLEPYQSLTPKAALY
jgi:hypothetical protein